MAEPGQILLFGAGSFIAQALQAALPAALVRPASHAELDRPDLLDGIATVVNCAKHPAIGSAHYELATMDPDLALARRIGERPIRYVMLSSRKVYAPADAPLAETAALGPQDGYGRHKLAAEEALRAELGERLTILRLANIFGDERWPGRRTFLALVLNRLAETGTIRFDMSPFVARDFLPVARCAALLARIAREPPGGVLNIGSGIGLPTGRLALWIIEGFGRGELVVARPDETDSFVLDVARLQAAYGPVCSLAELAETCRAIGRRLADSLAAPASSQPVEPRATAR